jgi:hypothetical protein
MKRKTTRQRTFINVVTDGSGHNLSLHTYCFGRPQLPAAAILRTQCTQPDHRPRPSTDQVGTKGTTEQVLVLYERVGQYGSYFCRIAHVGTAKQGHRVGSWSCKTIRHASLFRERHQHVAPRDVSNMVISCSAEPQSISCSANALL